MSDESVSRQLVVFSVADEEYAVPIGQVHEIIRFTQPRTVASTDPALRGVISLRGRILPVYDLTQSLGLYNSMSDGENNIVIVEVGDDMAGLIVGEVEEVVTIDSGQLDEAPAVGGEAIDGIAKLGDRLVVLLDCERLLGHAGAYNAIDAEYAA